MPNASHQLSTTKERENHNVKLQRPCSEADRADETDQEAFQTGDRMKGQAVETAHFRRPVQYQANRLEAWEKAMKSGELRSGRELKETQTRLHTAEEYAQKMAKENASLRKNLKQQESMIKKAQEDAFRSGEQGEWTPEEDSVINDQLNAMERLIRDFSKQSAIKSIREGDMEGKNFNWSSNPAFRKIAHNMLSKDGALAIQDPRLDKTAPHLLLSAWVACFIYGKILGDPLYFLAEFEKLVCKDENLCIRQGLTAFFALIKNCECVGVHLPQRVVNV